MMKVLEVSVIMFFYGIIIYNVFCYLLICALGPFASLRAEAGAVVQSCCNALTVGCDVWQKERESYKQGYKNKDCSSGSASLGEVKNQKKYKIH